MTAPALAPLHDLIPTGPFSDQLDSVHVLYDVAYLEERRKAGMSLSAPDRAHLFALLKSFGGDPGGAQRKHRRLPLMLAAVIKVGTRLGRATLLNMSAGGFFLAASIQAHEGDPVLLKVGDPAGGVQYSFPCKVLRARHERGANHLALAISGIPLEVRYHREERTGARLKRCANC